MTGVAGLLPLLLIIFFVVLFFKRTGRSRSRKGRGMRNVLIYSAFLVTSVVVYYVFVTQINSEATDLKLYQDYEDTLNQFHADPPVSYDEIDSLQEAGKWQYEIPSEQESLTIYSDSIVQVKRQEGHEPMIEVSYYRPATVYVEGIEVPEEKIRNVEVKQSNNGLFLRIPDDQYSISYSVVEKEVFINNFTEPNAQDPRSLRPFDNLYTQSFQVTVPNDLELEIQGSGWLEEIE